MTPPSRTLAVAIQPVFGLEQTQILTLAAADTKSPRIIVRMPCHNRRRLAPPRPLRCLQAFHTLPQEAGWADLRLAQAQCRQLCMQATVWVRLAWE